MLLGLLQPLIPGREGSQVRLDPGFAKHEIVRTVPVDGRHVRLCQVSALNHAAVEGIVQDGVAGYPSFMEIALTPGVHD